jgi:hypothetical protein
MADDYTIRVDAGDLADIIADRQSARADYETCVRDATEAASQWREEIGELLTQFNQFRRAVQEATGLDQPELLHDDELINRVRARKGNVLTLRDASVEIGGTFAGYRDVTAERAQPVWLQRGSDDPWTAPEQDGPLTDADIEHAHDAQRRHRQHGYVLGCAVHGAHPHSEHYCDVCTLCRPVKQDVDPAWLDTAQQRVGEQLADDSPPIKLEVDVTSLRQFQRMAQEQTDREDAEQAAGRDDGPPTEAMPAVEEPPTAPDNCTIGRVFTRDTDWDPGDLMPLAMVTRMGDWWEFSHIPMGAPSGEQGVYNNAALDKTHTFAELLNMHGTLWEVLDTSEQPSVAEQALVDDEKPPAKPNLHVATLYTSQQDGGSRWYELSDGWVVCASTLQNAQRDYPDLALRLTAVQDAHRDLRNEGIATS